jgi:CheY-like chemotaxis protein
MHNAAKYTEAGPRPGRRSPRGRDVVVEVRDDGMGIEPAEQESIFGMFVQLDTSLGRGAAGLGVGLTIARALVEMHGGSIGVEARGAARGRSSCRAADGVGGAAGRHRDRRSGEAARPGSPAARPPPASRKRAARGRRILVADDNVDFANSLANLLRLEGHQVRIAHDGRAALAAAGEQRPEVAFLDIGMPGLSGYELAASLRRDSATERIHLIAVTGWGQTSDKQRARDAGFDHHLVKPVDFDDILQLLATLPAPSGEPTPAAPT